MNSYFLLSQALVDETNWYAAARCQTIPYPKWTPITLQELTAYFGIRFFSVVSLPQMTMYWATDALYGNLFIPRVMKREQFDKIAQYLHVADVSANPPRTDPGHDKLAQVCLLLDHVASKCR